MRRVSLTTWAVALLGLLVSLAGCVHQSVQADGGGDGPVGVWAVRLTPGVAPEGVAARLGGVSRGRVGELAHTFLIEVPGGAGRAAEIDARLGAMADVVWFERQVARAYFPRRE